MLLQGYNIAKHWILSVRSLGRVGDVVEREDFAKSEWAAVMACQGSSDRSAQGEKRKEGQLLAAPGAEARLRLRLKVPTQAGDPRCGGSRQACLPPSVIISPRETYQGLTFRAQQSILGTSCFRRQKTRLAHAPQWVNLA